MPMYDKEVAMATPRHDNNTSQLQFSTFSLTFGSVFATKHPMVDLIIKINN